MGQGSSKQKHFRKDLYPHGRSSFRVEELLQSAAYQAWVMEYEKTADFKQRQVLPEKLPREVERDLLDRVVQDHLTVVQEAVRQALSTFTEPKYETLTIEGKDLQLHPISTQECEIYGPHRTKEPTLVGSMNANGEFLTTTFLHSN
ncbi:hypothetical protein BLNAU_3701 [Blattamonas nauphoetae]|uniref:Transposase n=1 Tax=Blattamonas nauphoetae TaxID=2049346 RepID=A0ABQ9YBW1_9EUKA|nr:hypothetical protein BLNAU_3701 [Blattamonas nauphoetae]